MNLSRTGVRTPVLEPLSTGLAGRIDAGPVCCSRMRLRIILPVLAVGLLVAGWGLKLRLQPGARRSGEAALAPVVQPEAAQPATPAAAQVPVAEASLGDSNTVPTTAESAAAQHQAYVTQRCATLEDLATDDTPEALAAILGELTNRDPEIRKAAINAAMQFGSREAIPKLMEAAEQTDEPDEKVAYLEAAKFLKLPTLGEWAAQARTNHTVAKP